MSTDFTSLIYFTPNKIISQLAVLLVESQWNTVQGLAAENLDECAPALEHSFCVKNKLLIRCPAIIKPVCSFNGFEYKTYPNSCYMDQDQLCRQDRE